MCPPASVWARRWSGSVQAVAEGGGGALLRAIWGVVVELVRAIDTGTASRHGIPLDDAPTPEPECTLQAAGPAPRE